MLAATWVKMSESGKKVNKNTNDISSIKRVTRKPLEVSRCSCAKQRQRNVQRKFFFVSRPIFVFSPSSLPSPLSITQFYILFGQTINIIRASLLALAKSIYYLLMNVDADGYENDENLKKYAN